MSIERWKALLIREKIEDLYNDFSNNEESNKKIVTPAAEPNILEQNF